MAISLEEAYISALKTQMKKWKSGGIEGKTPERVMHTIKTFLFDETLCREITKAALLMCDGPERLESKIQELIAYMHTLIKIDTDILKAWDIMKNHFRYDENQNLVWIDFGIIPEVVERRGWGLVRDRAVHKKNAQGDSEEVMRYAREDIQQTLGVVVYFMDSAGQWFAEYTLPPISRKERVGLKLEAIVPFEYWRELKVRFENISMTRAWFMVYNTRTHTTESETMEVLNDFQKTAFGDVQPYAMSRLVFCLKIEDGFQIPEEISSSTLFRKRTANDISPFQQSSAALLDELKMLTDSSDISGT
jgi:hypothetical protein